MMAELSSGNRSQLMDMCHLYDHAGKNNISLLVPLTQVATLSFVLITSVYHKPQAARVYGSVAAQCGAAS
jgi:hypothetical protein